MKLLDGLGIVVFFFFVAWILQSNWKSPFPSIFTNLIIPNYKSLNSIDFYYRASSAHWIYKHNDTVLVGMFFEDTFLYFICVMSCVALTWHLCIRIDIAASNSFYEFFFIPFYNSTTTRSSVVYLLMQLRYTHPRHTYTSTKKIYENGVECFRLFNAHFSKLKQQ